MLRHLLFVSIFCMNFFSIGYLSAADPEIFICKTEKATGFKVGEDGRTWKSVDFSTETTYLIRPAKDGEISNDIWQGKTPYVVVPMGGSFPEYVCPKGFGGYFIGETFVLSELRCDGIGEFLFNKENNRFISSYMAGFINSRSGEIQNKGDTPAVFLGSCARI
ncbi:MAG: hypothetical protein ACK4K8_11215 [Pannonibacter sp.]